MSKYKVTPIVTAVSIDDVNPIFGEGVTHIKLEDEGGGVFIVLGQDDREIRLDVDELELILDTAKKMIIEFNKQNPLGE